MSDAANDPGGADDDLWRMAVAGDSAAFGKLFTRHASAVHRYCYRRTGSVALAEDLTSIVFLHAWRRRADVNLDSVPVRGWLFGVATQVVRNGNRSLRRHRDLLARIPPPAAVGDHADDVAARIDTDRDSVRVRAAISRLPRADRDVLALAVLGELSYAEIAAALTLPIGTVRSRLSRARARLRADLASTEPDPPRPRGAERTPIPAAAAVPTARGELL
jgi:RNA polymerase sigma factor (sigma-70 family)